MATVSPIHFWALQFLAGAVLESMAFDPGFGWRHDNPGQWQGRRKRQLTKLAAALDRASMRS